MIIDSAAEAFNESRVLSCVGVFQLESVKYSRRLHTDPFQTRFIVFAFRFEVARRMFHTNTLGSTNKKG